ncbi:hypothetical protein Tco_1039077 [Tanacetum coccineum]
MATGIKSCGRRSKEPVRVVEPHVVEDYDDTEVPNTSSSKVPCAVKNKRKRRQSMDGAEEEILGVLKVIAGKILESQPPSKPETPTLEDC